MDSRKLAQIFFFFLAITQYQNCLSQPGLLKASVEKTGLTMEHTLEGPLRCQRENSWREYFVTQEEWGSLLWQRETVHLGLFLPCQAGWLSRHGSRCQSDRQQRQSFFIWGDSGKSSLLPSTWDWSSSSDKTPEVAVGKEKNKRPVATPWAQVHGINVYSWVVEVLE